MYLVGHHVACLYCPDRDEVLRRYREYDALWSSRKYLEDELREQDSRIHCCFYVMAPHRIHDMDVRFLKQVGRSNGGGSRI